MTMSTSAAVAIVHHQARVGPEPDGVWIGPPSQSSRCLWRHLDAATFVAPRWAMPESDRRARSPARSLRLSGRPLAPRLLGHDLDRQGQPSRAIASSESERPHRRRVSRHTPAPVHRQRALVAGVLVSPAIGGEQGRCASAPGLRSSEGRRRCHRTVRASLVFASGREAGPDLIPPKRA